MSKEIQIINALSNYIDDNDTLEALSRKIEHNRSNEDFSIREHIRGLIYALLSLGRCWQPIQNNQSKIDEIFYQFAPEKIKSENPEILEQKIRDIRCGNQRIKYQTASLNKNITFLQSIESEYGSIDKFYRTFEIYELIDFLNKNLTELGPALISEYLANVGYDIPKPDRHLKRIFAKDRLGYSKSESDKVNDNEIFDIIKDFSKKTGQYQKCIDYIFWVYCAQGDNSVCTANPDCTKCVIRQFCNKTDNKEGALI